MIRRCHLVSYEISSLRGRCESGVSIVSAPWACRPLRVLASVSIDSSTKQEVTVWAHSRVNGIEYVEAVGQTPVAPRR